MPFDPVLQRFSEDSEDKRLSHRNRSRSEALQRRSRESEPPSIAHRRPYLYNIVTNEGDYSETPKRLLAPPPRPPTQRDKQGLERISYMRYAIPDSPGYDIVNNYDYDMQCGIEGTPPYRPYPKTSRELKDVVIHQPMRHPLRRKRAV